MAEEKHYVKCGQCGAAMSFRREQAGGKFRCPKCHNPIELKLEEEEAVEEVRAPRAAAPRAPAKASGHTARGNSPAPRRGPAPHEASRGATRGRAPAPPPKPVDPAAAKKKKMILIGGIAAAVLVLGGIGAVMSMGKKDKAPEDAGTVAEGERLWKKIEADMRAGDTNGDADARKKALQSALETVEAARKTSDHGWPDYYAGRISDRLGKFDEAKEFFTKAAEKLSAKAKPYAEAERGLAMARKGHEMRLKTRRFRLGGVSVLADPAADAVEKSAQADLKKGGKTTDFFPAAMVSLTESESDRIDGRPSSAASKLDPALGGRANPAFAHVLMGTLYLDSDSGKWEPGMKSMDSAVTTGGGTPFARLSRAWGYRWRAAANPDNQDAATWLTRAIEDADGARKEGHPAAAQAGAAVRLDLALLEYEQAKDPKPRLDEADALLNEAGDDPYVQEIRAGIGLLRATIDEATGKDPRPALDLAISAHDKSVGALPDDALATQLRAGALMRRARAEASRGGDPRPLYDRAIADYGATINKDAKLGAVLGQATARVEKGLDEAKRGTDAMATFQKAIDDVEKLRENRLNKMNPAVLEVLGLAYRGKGEAELRGGNFLGENLSKSLDMFYEVMQLRPNDLHLALLSAETWLLRAEAYEKAEIDPRPAYGGAARALDGVIERRPNDLNLVMKRGSCRSKGAKFSLDKGIDVRADLTAAVNDFSIILKSDPNNLEALLERGRALYYSAQAEQRHTRSDPAVTLNSALRDLDQLAGLDKKNVKALMLRGDAVLWMGALEEAQRSSGLETYQRAAAAFEDVVAADSANADAVNAVGAAWYKAGMSVIKKDRKADASAHLDLAEKAFRKAIELGFKKAHINLGCVLVLAKRWDDAAAQLEKAAAENPDSSQYIDRLKEWVLDYKAKA